MNIALRPRTVVAVVRAGGAARARMWAGEAGHDRGGRDQERVPPGVVLPGQAHHQRLSRNVQILGRELRWSLGMGSGSPLLTFLLMVVSGWVHRHQRIVIEQLRRPCQLAGERRPSADVPPGGRPGAQRCARPEGRLIDSAPTAHRATSSEIYPTSGLTTVSPGNLPKSRSADQSSATPCWRQSAAIRASWTFGPVTRPASSTWRSDGQ